MMKNILLVKGGGGSEHEISLISARYIESQIDRNKFKVYSVEIDKGFKWNYLDQECSLNFNGELVTDKERIKIDMAIPCIHGFPGETGDIQSFFEMIKMPYFGCGPETSSLCFNKLSTKLWLEKHGIQTTPFHIVSNTTETEIIKAKEFFNKHKSLFIKATNQGSSVGCYKCTDEQEIEKKIKEAFKYSPFVILEKEVISRELEVAFYQKPDGTSYFSAPGEIICHSEFYTYEEKYAENSTTETHVVAKNIPDNVSKEIRNQANCAAKILKLRHLSRIDFFYSKDNEVFINEINTFPGHTPISMFPTMMENDGLNYSDYINGLLDSLS